VKEIEVYAVYNADDGRELLGYFDTLLAAKSHPFNKLNCTIVKLTGQMPEPKKMKKVATYVYINNDGEIWESRLLRTKEDAEKMCKSNGYKLIQWPYGDVIEVEEK